MESTGTVEEAVTVVDPVANEAVHEHENRFLCERVANRMQPTQLEETGTAQLRDVNPHQQLIVEDDPEVPDVCVGH